MQSRHFPHPFWPVSWLSAIYWGGPRLRRVQIAEIAKKIGQYLGSREAYSKISTTLQHMTYHVKLTEYT